MSAEPIEYGTCPLCGYKTLPVLELSPCGHDVKPKLAPLLHDGIVYSWSRVRTGESDRIMVMADFFDGSLRVTAPLIAEQTAIGDRVRLYKGGVTCYELRPAG